MAFGTPSETKQGTKNLLGISNQATAAGGPSIRSGTANMGTGADFFRTVLGGNRANTTALLAPDINRINGGLNSTFQAVNTLSPRGGGRFATNYQLPFQRNAMIQGLFNGARTQAAPMLSNIGSEQAQVGSNLFGLGTNASSDAARLGLQAQAQKNAMWQGLGQGLFGLATLPIGGFGGTLLGKLPGMGGGGSPGPLFRTPPFVPEGR